MSMQEDDEEDVASLTRGIKAPKVEKKVEPKAEPAKRKKAVGSLVAEFYLLGARDAEEVARLSKDKILAAWMLIQWLWKIKGASETHIKIDHHSLKRMGIATSTKVKVLRRLQAAGLISVQCELRKSALITVLNPRAKLDTTSTYDDIVEEISDPVSDPPVIPQSPAIVPPVEPATSAAPAAADVPPDPPDRPNGMNGHHPPERIEELYERRVGPLESNGASLLNGECPNCNGLMNINVKRQSFYCGECGKHGYIVELARLLDQRDAMKIMEEAANADINTVH
jgi:ribosomal protein S27AE